MGEQPLADALAVLVAELRIITTNPDAPAYVKLKAIDLTARLMKDLDTARPVEVEDDDPIEAIRLRALK